MNLNKYVISIVGYLNTKPFIYGLSTSPLWNEIDLKLEIPSKCALDFENGKSDLALVPVASLKDFKNYKIVTDFCIGAVDYVDTVCLFSNDPLENIHTIYLDNHSRTSVELITILNKKYWGCNINFVPKQNVEKLVLNEGDGKLMIGDKVIINKNEFLYSYDLGHEWYKYTKLPFVFAVWVAKSSLNKDFIIAFNNSLRKGINEIDKLKFLLHSPNKSFNLQQYYKESLNYDLGEDEYEGLSLFLKLQKEV